MQSLNYIQMCNRIYFEVVTGTHHDDPDTAEKVAKIIATYRKDHWERADYKAVYDKSVQGLTMKCSPFSKNPPLLAAAISKLTDGFLRFGMANPGTLDIQDIQAPKETPFQRALKLASDSKSNIGETVGQFNLNESERLAVALAELKSNPVGMITHIANYALSYERTKKIAYKFYKGVDSSLFSKHIVHLGLSTEDTEEIVHKWFMETPARQVEEQMKTMKFGDSELRGAVALALRNRLV